VDRRGNRDNAPVRQTQHSEYRNDLTFLYQTHVLNSRGKGKALPVHANKAYEGVEVYLHSSLTPALDGGVQESVWYNVTDGYAWRNMRLNCAAVLSV
jgi:hypothetical protein